MLSGGSHRLRRSGGQPERRRLFVLLAGLAALVLVIGVVGYVLTRHSAPSTQASGAPATSGAGVATTPSAPTTTLPPPPSEPGGGRRLFPGRRIVAFYGAPGGGALGVLGAASPAATWSALEAQAAPYAEPSVPVLPSYELIAFVVQHDAGADGTYSIRLSDAEIRSYLSVVRAHHGMLILDIQPGRGSFLAGAKTLAPFLTRPDVGLALDPEWEMGPGQLPGSVVGQTTAAEINGVGHWLDRFTAAHRLPQKLFLIHQWTPGMVQDKPDVGHWYHLATVFNMDGFGSWSDKVSVYQVLARDHRFRLGYKLFYRQDAPMHAPPDVLALTPPPWVIEYE